MNRWKGGRHRERRDGEGERGDRRRDGGTQKQTERWREKRRGDTRDMENGETNRWGNEQTDNGGIKNGKMNTWRMERGTDGKKGEAGNGEMERGRQLERWRNAEIDRGERRDEQIERRETQGMEG